MASLSQLKPFALELSREALPGGLLRPALFMLIPNGVAVAVEKFCVGAPLGSNPARLLRQGFFMLVPNGVTVAVEQILHWSGLGGVTPVGL